MKRFYVYKTTDKTNGKIYIGKSCYRANWEEYLGSGVLLKEAVKQKGKENFEKEILQEYETEDEAFEGEKYYIALLNSRNRSIGYNIVKGGNGAAENRHSHSQNYYNAIHSEEYREKKRKLSHQMWDNMTEEEYKERCRKAKEKWTEERKAQRSKMMKERFSDPVYFAEYRRKLSEGVRRVNSTPEYRQHLREAVNRPEAKLKRKKAYEKQHQDPFYKELNSRVNQPLSVLSKKFKKGEITAEELEQARKPLLELRDGLYKEYGKVQPKRRQR